MELAGSGRVSITRLAASHLLAGALFAVASASAQSVDVLVGRYQLGGTGANLHETTLNTHNVNPAAFGKLFTYELEGAIYAQPLIVSNLLIRGKMRNVVYVATTNDLVYALDADDPGPDGGMLWQSRLTRGGEFAATVDSPLVQGNIGILGTPVIDQARNTLYVVARTVESKVYKQYLHALDLTTGADKRPPHEISASVIANGRTFTFDPAIENSRAGLTLAQLKVIVAWSSLRDVGNYHGWVMAFDEDTLQPTGVFCTTCGVGPSGMPYFGGGIWQSGRPPSVDLQGFVYVFTGNGWINGMGGFPSSCPAGHTPLNYPPKPAGYYAESLVKLDPAHRLVVAGSWTPWNWCELDYDDLDLGGSGPVLMDVSGATLAIGGGKDGVLYTFNTGFLTTPEWVDRKPITDCIDPNGVAFLPNAGGVGSPLRDCFQVSTSRISGSSSSCPPAEQVNPASNSIHHVMGGPVYWPRSWQAAGGEVFVSVESDCVRRFPVITEGIAHDGNAQSAVRVIGHPGAILSLSADGEKRGTGILWMTYATDNSWNLDFSSAFFTKHSVLAAYDAGAPLDGSGLLPELWNSNRRADSRDSLGYFAKFNPPTIANGKVFVAAFPPPEWYSKDPARSYTAPNSMGYLVVYGLNPTGAPPMRSFAAELAPTVISPLLL